MAKRYIKWSLFFLLIVFSSCQNGMAVYHITRGNYDFFDNRLQQASYHYLKAWSCEEYRDVVIFNLGNVYFHLGEPQAAMEVWNQFQPGNRKNLNFRFFYNRSLLKFELGDYQGAFSDLKEALQIQPNNKEAKNNLEVILDRMNSQTQSAALEEKSKEPKKELSAASQRILEYVKRSEVFEWEKQDSPESYNSKDW